MKTKARIVISMVLLGWLVMASVAPAVVLTWTNLSGGNWNVAANWNLNRTPIPGDDVAITAAGTYTVTQNIAASVSTVALGGASGEQTLYNPGLALALNRDSLVAARGVLAFGGDSLTGPGQLTISGKLLWSGGNLNAPVVAPGGTLAILGAANKTLYGNLTNFGTMTWSGSGGFVLTASRVDNRPGALFDIQSDSSLSYFPSVGMITNAGTIRKTGGTAGTALGNPLFNTGTVDVQTGVISHSGDSIFYSGSSLLGSGTNYLGGGIVTLLGDITSQNLQWAGATLVGNATLHGNWNWTSGSLAGGAVLCNATNGTLHLRGDAAKGGIVGLLANEGTMVWSGAGYLTLGGGQIDNRAGALFEIQNDSVLNFFPGVGAITNAGTIRKAGGTAGTAIGNPLYNYGTIEVQAGLVSHSDGSIFYSGSALLGAGTNFLGGGNMALFGEITSENLQWAGVTLAGNATIHGNWNWTSGALAGGAVLCNATNGTLHLLGDAGKGIIVGLLANEGTMIWSGTGYLTMGGGQIDNRAGALFEIQNDSVLNYFPGPGSITNAGTIRKTNGTAGTLIGNPLFNTGTVDAQSGVISHSGDTVFYSGSLLLGSGTNYLGGGTVTLLGDISSQNLQWAGATLVGNATVHGNWKWTSGGLAIGATLRNATNGTLHIIGDANKGFVVGLLANEGTMVWSGAGSLSLGGGQIDNRAGALLEIQNDSVLNYFPSPGSITNAGTIRKTGGTAGTVIGNPLYNTGTMDAQSGTLAFVSSYSQNGGKLQFGLSSLTGFGRIQCSDVAPLTGTLGLNLLGGFLPKAGDAFALVSYPAYSGAFGAFDLPTAAAWQTNASIYGANAVTLTVLNARPNLDPISDKTGDEQTVITFTATATDPDLAQNRSFSLLNAPAGATINPITGVFTWTPTEAQGPSTNSFAVQVGDNGTPPLTHTQSVTVVVNEVNRAPVATPFALAPINELMPFVLVTNLATDPDLPTNTLSFALINPPPGMLIDAATGVITWTPSEAQGPSTNPISVRITDSGSPSLRATNTFTLVVAEVNAAPSLATLSNLTHVAGAIRWITNSASDPDLPTNQLSFSLVNPPPGMSIGPTSGLIIWAPPLTAVPATNTVTVRVTDNGSLALTDERSFVATLISPPRLRIASAGPTRVVLSWPAAATDAGFGLQSTTNLLSPTAWVNVDQTPVGIAGENRLTNLFTVPFQAYRLASALTPLPTLQISNAPPNGVVVSWPVAATATGFVLQTAPNLQVPVVWSDATNSLGTNGSLSFITDLVVSPQRCYRLRLSPLP